MHDRNETPNRLLFGKIRLHYFTRTQQIFTYLGLLFSSFFVVFGIVFVFFPKFFMQTYPILFYIWLICVPLGVMFLLAAIIAVIIQKSRQRNAVDE